MIHVDMAQRRKHSDKIASENLRRIWDEKKKSLGLTQMKAAELLGLTQGTVSQYLTGRISIGTDALIKWAHLLAVEPDDIRPNSGFTFVTPLSVTPLR